MRLITIALVMLLSACTTLEVVDLKPKTDNSTLEELVEAPIIVDEYREGWTDEQRGFWSANYWAMLASNPNTRQRFLPFSVYKISSCIVDTWAKDMPLEDFVKNVAQSNDPMVARQMYNITYECTTFEVMRMQTERKDTIEPKDAI